MCGAAHGHALGGSAAATYDHAAFILIPQGWA